MSKVTDKSKTVSLIIPAYKADWCLFRCLESVAKQKHPPHEVMLGIDYCEATLQKAMCWPQNRLKVRVFWFDQHQGCYRIRNTMAELAKGAFVAFFDSDDEMYPDYLSTLMSLSARYGNHPHRVNACDVISEGTRPPRKYHNPCQFLMPRPSFLMMGGFEAWECGADSELKERMDHLHIPVAVAGRPLATEYKHAGSLTKRPDTNMSSPIRRQYKAIRATRRLQPLYNVTLKTAKAKELFPGDKDTWRKLIKLPPRNDDRIIVLGPDTPATITEKLKQKLSTDRVVGWGTRTHCTELLPHASVQTPDIPASDITLANRLGRECECKAPFTAEAIVWWALCSRSSLTHLTITGMGEVDTDFMAMVKETAAELGVQVHII